MNTSTSEKCHQQCSNASLMALIGQMFSTSHPNWANDVDDDNTEADSSCFASARSFEIREDQLVTSPKKIKTRVVRFNTDNIQSFPNGRDMASKEERSSCWFSKRELRKMQLNMLHDAKRLFASSKPIRGSLRKNFEWKKKTAQAYRDCVVLKTEQGVDTGLSPCERESLKSTFQHCEWMWGLERSLVCVLRGREIVTTRNLILKHAESQIHAPMTAEERHNIYRRLSVAVTRPSRAFAREIALAQEAALK